MVGWFKPTLTLVGRRWDIFGYCWILWGEGEILLDIVGRRWDIVGYCGEKVEYCWILWGKGGILRDIFVVFEIKKIKKMAACDSQNRLS